MKERMVKRLLSELRKLNDSWTVPGYLGSGPHARPLGLGNTQKIIVPGDDKSIILRQISYLFVDLAIDLKWSDSDVDQLRREIYGADNAKKGRVQSEA